MKKFFCGLSLCLICAFVTACSSESISAVSEFISVFEEIEQDYSNTENAADVQSEPIEEQTKPAEQSEASENTASLPETTDNYEPENTAAIDEHGTYTTKEDVALYIHTYNKLPENFITKKEAEALGWPGGELEKYAPGKCIGGSYFGNYEKLLPEKKGREYHECDIDTLGAKSRGAKRIVYSNDGLIYYTEDHYESFELLYGEE